MNQIVSLFIYSRGDYEKVKHEVWEENWKAMRLYSAAALVAFGLITLVSVFSLSIGENKWVYLTYTILSLAFFWHFSLSAQKPLGERIGCIRLFFRTAAVRHNYGNAEYA